MQFIKPDINLDIIGKRRLAYTFSLILILVSVGSLIYHGGPRYGVDFAGGTAVVVKFDEPVDTAKIRQALEPIGLGHATIQKFESQSEKNAYRIRADLSEQVDQSVPDALKDELGRALGVGVTVENFSEAPTRAYLTERKSQPEATLSFSESVSTASLRQALEKISVLEASIRPVEGKDNKEFLVSADFGPVQHLGLATKIRNTLEKTIPVPSEVISVEMVGPQVGKSLREKALSAMFYALLFITIYISGRFELKWVPAAAMAVILSGVVYVFSLFGLGLQWLLLIALVVALICFYLFQLKFAMGAIVALIHDVTITVGVFSLFGYEFTLPIIAALLTIIGYSLNDTIIVYDRIRENSKKLARQPLDIVINRSINETLSRTILTSFTTLLVVACLFALGGEIIHNFAFALLVGIIVGTYSSIYVASPVLLIWRKQKSAG